MTTRGRAVGSMSAVATQEPQPFNTATWLKDSVAAIAAAAVSALGAGSEGFAPWGFVLVVIAGVVPQHWGAWASYLSQASLFYGLVFMTVGISIVASAAWRLEHRGNNWNQLMLSTKRASRIFAVKTSAIVVLIAVMQLVFIVCALALGFVLGVRRLPPTVLHPL